MKGGTSQEMISERNGRWTLKISYVIRPWVGGADYFGIADLTPARGIWGQILIIDMITIFLKKNAPNVNN